jgi:hypothetical protein
METLFCPEFPDIQKSMTFFKVPKILLSVLLITNSMKQSPSWEANRSWDSRNSSQVMEPEGSSPYSQEPATCPYPEPD